MIKGSKTTIVSTNINDLYQKANTPDVYIAIPKMFPLRQSSEHVRFLKWIDLWDLSKTIDGYLWVPVLLHQLQTSRGLQDQDSSTTKSVSKLLVAGPEA